MVTTVDINYEDNFWEAYPNFKAVEPFKKLNLSDRTKGKIFSSKKMWAIALIYDRSSEYYNLPETGDENKIDLVMENLELSKWLKTNREEFEQMALMYRKMTETPTMRALRELEEKLDERSKFLRDTKYDIGMMNDKGQLVGGTADILEKMFSNTQKVFETVEKTRALVYNEKVSSTKGNVEESLSDKGEI